MRWSDMDAYRHINNSAYLAYLEQARVAMFFERHEGFSGGTVIARHEIDYLRPVVYTPQPLRLELWIGELRGAAFTVHYEVCLLYTSPSPRDGLLSRMPSSA